MHTPRYTLACALWLCAAATAVILISLPGLNGPLVLDSVKLHALEPVIETHGNAALLHTPGFGDSMGGLNRIVAMASFVANIQVDGELSPFSLRLTNVGIHIATGLLVFLLTRLLLGSTSHAPHAALLAAATAALWLLSPVNFNVSMYAVQRMAQLSALFTLAGLCLYTCGRLHPDVLRGRLYVALAFLACLPLAVLSKPTGALLLPLAFLVEVYFLHPVRPLAPGRRLALAGILGAVAGVAALLYLKPGILSYGFRDFTLAERLLSQPRALASYLQHILLPLGGDTAIYEDFHASTRLLEPLSTLLALLALGMVAVFCALFRRGVAGLAAFGLAFFLVGHVLESTFIPLELYFLHRNYLPAYGIYFALVCLLWLVLPNRRFMVALLAVYTAYFGAVSYARSLTWSSRESIVSAAVHYHPGSVRAWSDFAQTALDRGRIDAALTASNRAVALGGTAASHFQRLYMLCHTGAGIPNELYDRLGNAGHFGVANELSQAQGNLLRLYRGGGCERLAVERLVEALDALSARYRDHGRNPWTIDYYAVSFLHAGGFAEGARTRLERRLERGHLESGLYLVELLIEEGMAEKAGRTLDGITSKFENARVDRYAATIDEFRDRIEGSAAQ